MRLSNTILAAYAVPAFALAALYLPLFTYVAPFYAAERGVDLAALGVALIGIRLFDAVSDPLVGWLSDRTPAAWGRRRVWLSAAVPLIVLASWQVFVPHAGAGLWHAVLWLFVLTLGWTMAQTPYAAWGAELAPDYHGRTRVTGWREAFVLLGTLGATIAYVSGDTPGEGLFVIAMLILLGLPLGVVITVLAVPDPSPASATRLGWREGMRTLRDNRAFRILLGGWVLNGFANGVPVSLFLFYTGDLLGLDQAETGIMFLIYFGAAILGMPGWTWAARRIGKHRAWAWAMIWASMVFAAALFLGEGDVMAFAVISALTGVAFGADLALPPAMQADVIADDTKRTGAARAGLFFAIWQVATKGAVALSSGIAYVALNAAGFQPGEPNDSTALWALAVLYAGVPIVLKLAAVAWMWRFPLGREMDQDTASTRR